MRLRAGGWALMAVLPALVLMSSGLLRPLHGAHLFRQAHVAANVDKFISRGLSLKPATYNLDVPGALFDFPAYQWTVAFVCRTLGTPTVATARAVQTLFFVLLLVVLWKVLPATGLRRSHVLFTLVLASYAPLSLFYFQTPLVDGLALTLSVLSIYGYVVWERRGWPAFVLMIAAGVLATLVKNPVYFPFFCAVTWHRLHRRGPVSLPAGRFAAYVLAVAGAVVLFKLYANAVNQTGGFFAAEEVDAYFGPLADRLRRQYWQAILTACAERALPSPAAWLALAGGILFLRRFRGPWRTFYTGLSLGCVASVLLFFNRHREHDYYQLPFVLPLAFFAGYAVQWGAVRLRVVLRGRSSWRAVAEPVLGASLLAMALHGGYAGFEGLSAVPNGDVVARGGWLQAHTRPDDFVAYVVGSRADNWDPSQLYFAQRDGYNLGRPEVNFATLARLHRRHAASYGRFLVYCPWPSVPVAGARLEALGARLMVEGEAGRLYWLEPRWLRPAESTDASLARSRQQPNNGDTEHRECTEGTENTAAVAFRARSPRAACRQRARSHSHGDLESAEALSGASARRCARSDSSCRPTASPSRAQGDPGSDRRAIGTLRPRPSFVLSV